MVAVEDRYAGFKLHRINEDDVKSAYEDGRGRQEYSRQALIDAHLWMEWYHHEAKAKGAEWNKGFGQYFVIGPKGAGKTVGVNNFCAPMFGAGIDVFSASGLLYGYRLEPAQVYAFAKIAQPNCCIYFDETHEWAHALGGQRRAQQVFENSTAELRKLECDLFLSTVLDNRVSGVLKHETMTVLVPQKYTPASAKPSVRAEGVKPRFPKWCYMKATKIGPYPWQQPGLAEEMGLVDKAKVRKKTSYIPPSRIYRYTRLMNSFERGRIGEGRSVQYDDVEDLLLRGLGWEAVEQENAQREMMLRESAEFKSVLKLAAERELIQTPMTAKEISILFVERGAPKVWTPSQIKGFMAGLGVPHAQNGTYAVGDIMEGLYGLQETQRDDS